jgi:hypothetical protein
LDAPMSPSLDSAYAAMLERLLSLAEEEESGAARAADGGGALFGRWALSVVPSLRSWAARRLGSLAAAVLPAPAPVAAARIRFNPDAAPTAEGGAGRAREARALHQMGEAADIVGGAVPMGGDGNAAPPDADAVAAGRRLAAAEGSSPLVYPGSRLVPLYGSLVSWNCNVTLNVSVAAGLVDSSTLDAKAMGYSLMATVTGIALMGVLTFQIVRSASPSAATRVSMASVGGQAVIDAYACFLYAASGLISPSLFSAFAVTAFVNFMIFGVLGEWCGSRHAGQRVEAPKIRVWAHYARYCGALTCLARASSPFTPSSSVRHAQRCAS